MHDVLEQVGNPAALLPDLRVQGHGELAVVADDLRQLRHRRLVINDQRHLKVQPQAALVHVYCPKERKLVVNDDALGMKQSLFKLEDRSVEHTSELQSRETLVCRLLLE